MIIGVPREIKVDENRVGLVPAGVEALVSLGHRVIVEANCAVGIGLGNEQYIAAGAEIADLPSDVWAAADMIVKVKEPLEAEYPLLRDGQIVFTYFHFAADRPLTEAVLASGISAVLTRKRFKGQLALHSFARHRDFKYVMGYLADECRDAGASWLSAGSVIL